MIWSTGSAIAHRAMDAIMGPRVFQIEEVPSAAPAAQVDACARQYKAFNDVSFFIYVSHFLKLV